jgi:hypothetical protein
MPSPSCRRVWDKINARIDEVKACRAAPASTMRVAAGAPPRPSPRANKQHRAQGQHRAGHGRGRLGERPGETRSPTPGRPRPRRPASKGRPGGCERGPAGPPPPWPKEPPPRRPTAPAAIEGRRGYRARDRGRTGRATGRPPGARRPRPGPGRKRPPPTTTQAGPRRGRFSFRFPRRIFINSSRASTAPGPARENRSGSNRTTRPSSTAGRVFQPGRSKKSSAERTPV